MPAPLNHPPYPGCETGGRPLKYTPEFIEAEAEAFEEWMKLETSLYFKKFALERGYSPQRLNEFAEMNQKFSEVYSKAREWQECRLVEGGLTSEFNSGFCKFVMGNTCGWADRQETKISGDAANPLQFVLGQVDGQTKGLLNNEIEQE